MVRRIPFCVSLPPCSMSNLLHQHVCGFDPDAHDTRQQAHHGMRPHLRCLLQSFQTRQLNLSDLFAHQPQPFHIPSQRRHGVGWDRLSLGCAQSAEALRRLLQFRIETTNAKPHKRSLHPVNEPAALANEALALAVRPLGIFLCQRWKSPQPQAARPLLSSLTVLDQDSTLIAVIEMSLSSWLVAGIVPGIERQPLKKLEADKHALLLDSVTRAGRSCCR